MRSRRRRVALLVAVLALVGVVAAAWRRSALAEWTIELVARMRGLPLTLRVQRVGAGSLEASDVRLGAAMEAAALRVTWRPGDLLRGRVDRVVVDGLRVSAAWREGGLVVEPRPRQGAGGAAPPALPLRTLELHDARIRVETSEGTLDGRADGRVGVDEAGAPTSLVLHVEVAPLPPWLAAPLTASIDVVSGGVVGVEGRAQIESGDGRIRIRLDAPRGATRAGLEIAVRGLDLPAVASGVDLTARLTLARDGAMVVVRSDEAVRASVASLGAPLGGPFGMRADPPGSDRVLARVRAGGRAVAAATLTVGGPAGATLTARFATSVTMDVGWLALKDGELRLPDQAVGRGMKGDFTWRRDGGRPLALGRLRVEQVASLASPAWVAPLAVAARLIRRADGIRMRAEARGRDGVPRVVAAGEVDRNAGSVLRIRLEPVRLDETRPETLSPVLAAWVDRARGTVTAEATMRRAADRTDADARLALDDVGLAGPGRALEGLHGVVHLAGWPLATREPARIAFGRAQWGVELTDGVLEVQVEAPRRGDLRSLHARLYGGDLSAHGSLAAEGEARLDVAITALDLGRLLEAVQASGLSGTGGVDASLTARRASEGILLEDGRFAATGDGWIRYRPAGQPPPDMANPQGTAIARAALYNFHYEKLSGTLQGQASGELRLTLRLEGANPDLYGGYPVVLDLNVNGPFLDLMRSSQAVLSVPESVRRRLGGKRAR